MNNNSYKIFDSSCLKENTQKVFHSLHDYIFSAPELSKLRNSGPIIAGQEFWNLCKEYAQIHGIIDPDEVKDLYCVCLTAEFWDDIPNE